MPGEVYELHANICSVFSNPKRLEIIDILRDGEKSVSEIMKRTKISKTNLSQHLSLMRDRGIVTSRREGQNIYYSISNKKIIQAYDLMLDVLRELTRKKASQLKEE
ncbi:MAG: transcriptional regulator [Spirochaetes bacterium]|nr:MAG: transcriptional regulator [Spirochaetota bacterium]